MYIHTPLHLDVHKTQTAQKAEATATWNTNFGSRPLKAVVRCMQPCTVEMWSVNVKVSFSNKRKSA